MLKHFSLQTIGMSTMTQINQSNKQMIAQQMEPLIQYAMDSLADGKVTFGEMVNLGGMLASKVNQFEQLSGIQKQGLVLDVVERALQRILTEQLAGLPEEQRDEFQKKIERASSFVKETLPSVLTLAVQASRGELNLGKVVQFGTSEEGVRSVWNLLGLVCPCMKIRVEVPSKVATVVQLEMSKVDENQSSKEQQTPLPEDESKSQESREASTVSH